MEVKGNSDKLMFILCLKIQSLSRLEILKPDTSKIKISVIPLT